MSVKMKLFSKVLLVASLMTMTTTATEMTICVDNHDNTCQHCDANVTLENGIQETLHNVNSSVTKKVVLCSRQVLLQSEIFIEEVSFIWIDSHFKLSTIKCMKRDFGIQLVNVKNVTLRNIKVENCGGQYNSTSMNTTNSSTHLLFKTSIYLLNCTDIAISGVYFAENNGIGLTLIDCDGSVVIEGSTFNGNAIDSKTLNTEHGIPGGGGLYIEFSYCPPGGLTQNIFCANDRVKRVENSTYTIKECSFEKNTAHSVKEEKTSLCSCLRF